jgi:Abortive infection alpha
MDDRRDEGPEGLDAIPALARIALSAGWHTAGWALRTSVGVPRRMLELALSPEKAIDLAREVRDAAPGPASARSSAAPSSDGAADQSAKPSTDSPPAENGDRPAEHAQVARNLREEGEQLLRRSRDVRYQVDAHPAYERILSELAPDEGRILRLLLLDGPQPAVDIRTGGPVGLVRSRLLAPGLSMIGARAGCRYVDRVPSYLNNLFRLGLVWFSRETLRDPLDYQVLEAQPEVLSAIHSVRHAKVVRRSIHLTPFGEDFCRVCLTPETTVMHDLPQHSVPPEATTTPQPPTETMGG